MLNTQTQSHRCTTLSLWCLSGVEVRRGKGEVFQVHSYHPFGMNIKNLTSCIIMESKAYPPNGFQDA